MVNKKARSIEAKVPLAKLSPSTNPLQGTSAEELQLSFVNHLEFSLAKDEFSATSLDAYKSLALTVRDRLIERWIETQQAYYRKGVKRVYYLSMEFLIGRLLGNALINLGLTEKMTEALQELGYSVEQLEEMEAEAGLGNGGLGRLAACFLDSMATLELPACGYGIRYEYGIFAQKIHNGEQIEFPDEWLQFGNPWEIERPEYAYNVQFYGHVHQYVDSDGKSRFEWTSTDDVRAIAFDTPIPGYKNNTVNHLRLWAAKSARAFNLDYFNHGDYYRAVHDKIESETISRVLYPKDDFFQGKELRLKQEYFLVSATLQDIIRRYRKTHENDFSGFSENIAIQLNDTHPALAIPELMRILIDVYGLEWDDAWQVTSETFAYTNHTVLPEALEIWPVRLFERVLPRHLQIIYEINRRWLEMVTTKFPGSKDRIPYLSIIEEDHEKRVRMARLAIVGSHKVNGVSALHTEILKTRFFRYFYEIWPEKFTNKTNGITQRRWLIHCNPGLTRLISGKLGFDWAADLASLKGLEALAEDAAFQRAWKKVKEQNKQRLAAYILETQGTKVVTKSLFDVQVKRLHEYKRQILNALHTITLYNRIKNGETNGMAARTVIFAGKAAPGYFLAKLTIRLINGIASVVNNDPEVGALLKVIFLPNYSVGLAEKIIPAADLSEQISTAGTEASGTGNMKFALNGALTIGTLDGANVEIREEVGEDNIFIFGLKAPEVDSLRRAGYHPRQYYEGNPELKLAIDMIAGDAFSPSHPGLFQPLVDSLLYTDQYLVLADYAAYVHCQQRVNETYNNSAEWTRKSIINAANMGKFSSDRTIREYADEIWKAASVPIALGAGNEQP